MKRFLIVAMVAAVALGSFVPAMAASKEEIAAGEYLATSKLLKTTIYAATATTTANVCRPKTVGTYGTATPYQGTIKPPFKITIKALQPDASSTLNIALDSDSAPATSTSAVANTAIPVSLNSNLEWSKVFFSDPNISFSTLNATASNWQIQLWGTGLDGQ